MKQKTSKTILILHRIPYQKIRYHEIIDHDLHNVIYVVSNITHDIDENIRKTIIQSQPEQYVDSIICTIYSLNIKVDIVIALSEYNLTHAALIRSALGLFNVSDTRNIYNVRDKWLMKRCVMNAGILTAKGALLESKEGKDLLVSPHKLVVKPTRGAASERTFILESGTKTFDNPIIHTIKECSDTFLIEKFVTGDIYHFDGLVFDGKVIFCIASKYIGDCLNFVNGNPLASVQLDTSEEYIPWIKSCIQAVGIRSGAFHLEGILHKNDMYFLEIGNRAGGAGVVACTEKATNINLMQEEVKIAYLGKDYSPPTPQFSKRIFGWFVIPEYAFVMPTDTKNFLYDIPELIQLNLEHNYQKFAGVSYSENNNPCTGLISAQSMENANLAVKKVYNIICRSSNDL